MAPQKPNSEIIKMVDTYAIDFYGSGGNESRGGDVFGSINGFFRSRGIEPEKIDLPARLGDSEDGEYNIKGLKKRFDFSKLKRPSIVLNGHGRFHSVTFFLVEGLKENVSYVHIDAHSDAGQCNPKEVNYAGFMDRILQLPHVSGIYLLGLAPANMNECLGYYTNGLGYGTFREDPSQIIFDGNVKLFLGESTTSLRQRANRMFQHLGTTDGEMDILERYQRDHKGRFLMLDDFNVQQIQTDDVYVSVDLDVIMGFPTGWPKSGRISLERVIELVSSIGKEKKIIGADICGLELVDQLGKRLSKKKEAKGLEGILRVYNALTENMG